MDMMIETERLILKVFSPNCADWVLDFYLRNRNFLEPWEPDRAANFYTKNFQRINLTLEYNEIINSKFLRYWIIPKNTPYELAGTVCFSNIQRGPFQSCMIGYKIDEHHCRNGYGHEALRAAIKIIFEKYGLHRIEALVHPHNEPSIKLLYKSGFTMEGTSHSSVQLNGFWQDHLRFALVNSIPNSIF